MEKCSYAIKYKAIRHPECGCELCEIKWLIAEACLDIMDRPNMGGLDANGVIQYKKELARRSKSLLNNIESLNNKGKS